MALDFRDQYFGCEIEMTGLTRQQAARTLAELFGTSITHYGGTYDGYRVTDREGKDWKIVSDGSMYLWTTPTRTHSARAIRALWSATPARKRRSLCRCLWCWRIA